MDEHPPIPKRLERAILGMILLLFAVVSAVGITWGLPSRSIDKYLFGDDPPWPGEKIYRLAGAGEKFSPDRGADVDADPLDKPTDDPILLTGTEKDVAKIYLRYRLYTYQPDEMITMMALAGMNPRRLQLDPKLYQYGGLFIYPVGALLGACDLVGLIEVRGDVVYYLDNPDEFGRFYVVARAYSASWGMLGVVVVFLVARRLAGSRAGLLAALLFALMPVVVCMAHEGKPHLPGAVLMLLAVLLAMRYLSSRAAGFSPRGQADPPRTADGHSPDAIGSPRGRMGSSHAAGGTRDWWLMCICCGAALGMVLSSWPILVLIPLLAVLDWCQRAADFSPRGIRAPAGTAVVARTLSGTGIAIAVYLITNPYIVINALLNREVLRSNFGNSLAMYQIDRVWEGFVRVLQLTTEGATLPIVVLGTVAMIAAISRKKVAIAPLFVAAAIFFLQFVLIGAGKPAEYGRFGVFTNTALAIGTACLLAHRWTRLREIVNWLPAGAVAVWVGLFGSVYLVNFHRDATLRGSRIELVKWGNHPLPGRVSYPPQAVLATPAPYSLPPANFAKTSVRLFRSRDHFLAAGHAGETLLEPVDMPEPPRDDRGNPVFSGDILLGFLYQNDDPTLASVFKEFFIRPTPISWANKPFYFDWPTRAEVTP